MNPVDILKLQLQPLIEKLNNLDANSYQDEDLKELLMSNTVMLYFLQGGSDYQKVMDELYTAVNDYAKEFLRPPTAAEIEEDKKHIQ